MKDGLRPSDIDQPRFRHYLLQSVLAAIFMGVLLAILRSAGDFVLLASLASTAFLVFAQPRSESSSPRCVIGGHWLSMAFGGLCVLPVCFWMPESVSAETVAGAVSVGGAMLIMTLTDTEHPPAAGTALAMILERNDLYRVVAAVVIGSLFLSAVWAMWKNRLRDLT